MADQKGITLHLTPQAIEKSCREIVGGSSNTGRQLASLIALEGFIAHYAGADSHSPVFEEIQSIIRNFTADMRSKLLLEQAQALAPALRGGGLHEISRLYASVSRNGFEQLLLQALDQLNGVEHQHIAHWVDDWCRQAERAAAAASGYPDAMDFRGAGIDLGVYRAMSDIRLQMTHGGR